MIPKAIETLAEYFGMLPGVGPRQAARFVYFLLKQDAQTLAAFKNALQALQSDIGVCENCFMPYEKSQENENKKCSICTAPKRTSKIICVVEKESDAERMEKLGLYEGVYFVLSGTLGVLQKDAEIKRRVGILKERLLKQKAREVILGLNPTREGIFTNAYVEEALSSVAADKKPLVTRLGRGLTTGAELEYTDEETLRSALLGRK